MPEIFEIRALFDSDTITVYQAYNKEIANAASNYNKFIKPFSFNRMTWIKPSFLWMMERSNWGQKSNQECTLSIKVKRDSFEKALSLSVLTSPSNQIYPDSESWRKAKDISLVNVQWDPERDLYGNKLNYRSIQIGISRHIIAEFNNEWIVEITDISELVTKILKFKKMGENQKVKRYLPKEKIYTLSNELKSILGIKIE